MTKSNPTLIEIADNWNREAKREASQRYFFFVNEVKQISNGKKSFVIGRKGTGKTAISEYINNLKDKKTVFTKRLSFSEFPYKQLYDLKDSKYPAKSQYMTIWKYLIYSSMCEMMLENTNINSELRQVLSWSYEKDILTELPRKIDKWVNPSFELMDLFNKNYESITWLQKVNLQEDYINKYLDSSNYYIIFDGLDDDYTTTFRNNKADFSAYNNALTSLFKAVHSIKNSSLGLDKKIFPIVFLRDDIYKEIRDNDKTKWGDLSIELDWDRDKIRQLIAFRITRAINPDATHSLNFNDAWLSIFSKLYVHYGNEQQKAMHSYEFIDRMTQLRPRDYIEYISACAKKALAKQNTIIEPDIVRSEEKAFSNYLKSETIDEIYPVLPEIESIFQIITEISTTSGFSLDKFKTTYLDYLDRSAISEKDVSFVLQKLFDFNIIGNITKQSNNGVFRFKNKEAKFNPKEKIILNRGLYKSLQVV